MYHFISKYNQFFNLFGIGEGRGGAGAVCTSEAELRVGNLISVVDTGLNRKLDQQGRKLARCCCGGVRCSATVRWNGDVAR